MLWLDKGLKFRYVLLYMLHCKYSERGIGKGVQEMNEQTRALIGATPPFWEMLS